MLRKWVADIAERLLSPRFIRFLVVGSFNTLVGYGLYAAFVLVGIWPELSLGLAVLCGMLIGFHSTGRFVFASRDPKRLWRFIGSYVVIYGLDAVILRVMVRLGVDPLLAQFILMPIAALASFLTLSLFVFRPLPEPVASPSEAASQGNH